MASGSDCRICLAAPMVHPARPATCKHAFCLDCIAAWAENVNTCPLCRSSFEALLLLSDTGSVIDQACVDVRHYFEPSY